MRTTLVFSTHNLSLATFLSRAVAGLSATTPREQVPIQTVTLDAPPAAPGA
jgi:ABC-type nitrate/sulfonate/bicarbonate transport system ATPase subunit